MNSLQTLNKFLFPFNYKWHYSFFTLFILFFTSFYHSTAQDDFTKEQTREVLESISKYTSGVSDKTTQLLKKQGYTPPVYLSREFKQYPAIRKLEMAYKAAENAKKNNGKKFLALLSKDLAQRYEGAKYEKPLKDIILKEVKPQKIKFKHSKKLDKINLPKEIKHQIFSISKYTERGALGGTRGVLKHKFGLHDADVYDILRSSKSSKEAIEIGLSKSKTPPSHRERIRHLSTELQKNYEGARYDKKLIWAAQSNNDKNVSITQKKTPERNEIADSFSNESNNIPKKTNYSRAKTKYNNFMQKNYANPNTRKFTAMNGTSRGLGGVIFGSPIMDESNLPNISHFKFMLSERKNSDSLEIGTLEFVFEDGTEIIETSVILEDILVANEIIFGEDENFVEGNGIGLAGIYQDMDYLNDMVRWEAITHPAVQNLELAWSCLLSDVLPMASKDVWSSVEDNILMKDSILLAEWFDALPSTWKIMDIPLSIRFKDGRLVYTRSDLDQNEVVDDAFLRMQGFYYDYWGEEIIKEDEEFYKLIPLLTSNIEEYKRLNDFAKVLSLFRWAKSKGGKLISNHHIISVVPTPEVIFINTNDELEYLSRSTEKKEFEKRFREELNELKKIDFNNNSFVDSLNLIFLNKWTIYEKNMENFWNIITAPTDDYQTLCNTEIKNDLTFIDYDDYDYDYDYDDEFKMWKQNVFRLIRLADMQNRVFESFKGRYCSEYQDTY